MSLELPISHKDQFECEGCGAKISHAFTIQYLEYESSDERDMGAETQYSFTEEVPCPQCSHLNEVTGEVWEYPDGAVNLVQLT
jgi:DNA-directed RNA polymerase subunit RPC12/RpoP